MSRRVGWHMEQNQCGECSTIEKRLDLQRYDEQRISMLPSEAKADASTIVTSIPTLLERLATST